MFGEFRAVRVIVEGRVQGIGFRWWMLGEAQALGVRGWVRNLWDGRVEVVASASGEAVERLIDVAREGPPGARVTGITVEDIPQQDVDTKSFVIKH